MAPLKFPPWTIWLSGPLLLSLAFRPNRPSDWDSLALAPWGAHDPKFPGLAPRATQVPMAAPGERMDVKEARVEEDDAPTVDPSLHAAALGSRPGVLRVGFLQKEGGNALTRIFTAKRFFVLLGGRLEYYEERRLKIAPSKGDDDIAGIKTNDWNLVVFIRPTKYQDAPGRPGFVLGDVLIGTARCSRCNLSAALADRTTAHTITVLRRKGEVPLGRALFESVGETRLRITVATKELVQPPGRPPYLLIAPDARSRDAWLQALQQAAASEKVDTSGGEVPWTTTEEGNGRITPIDSTRDDSFVCEHNRKMDWNRPAHRPLRANTICSTSHTCVCSLRRSASWSRDPDYWPGSRTAWPHCGSSHARSCARAFSCPCRLARRGSTAAAF